MTLDLAAIGIVAIPLLSAGLLLVLGRRTDAWGHWLGVLLIMGAIIGWWGVSAAPA